MRTLENPYSEGGCFFCSPSNPVGLKLTFHETETEPNELVCRWYAHSQFRGLGKILHGGIQSGLFDEIMGWTTHFLTQQMGVTSSLNVQFLKPLYIEQEIEIRCRIQSRNGSKVNLEAEIKNGDGAVCTRAVGTYVVMDSEKFNRAVSEE